MANIDSNPAGDKVVRTICEVHREIYRHVNKMKSEGKIAEEDFDFVVPRLREAFTFAKKMNNKLRQYKMNYDDGWWQTHRLDGGELSE